MVRYPYLLFDADDTLLDFSRNGDKAFSLLCAKYCLWNFSAAAVF